MRCLLVWRFGTGIVESTGTRGLAGGTPDRAACGRDSGKPVLDAEIGRGERGSRFDPFAR